MSFTQGYLSYRYKLPLLAPPREVDHRLQRRGRQPNEPIRPRVVEPQLIAHNVVAAAKGSVGHVTAHLPRLLWLKDERLGAVQHF